MLRCDPPSNNKRGDACIFYRTTFPLNVLNIPYLCECLSFDRNSGRFVILFISIDYLAKYKTILKSKLKLNLDASLPCDQFLTLTIGDFNGKSKTDDQMTRFRT